MSDDLSTMTFEELVDELERITRQMAAGDIGIEQVADLYERAGRAQAEAAARLEKVRQRLEDKDGESEDHAGQT